MFRRYVIIDSTPSGIKIIPESKYHRRVDLQRHSVLDFGTKRNLRKKG